MCVWLMGYFLQKVSDMTRFIFSTSNYYFRISDDAGFSTASSKALFMWEQPL